jgi:uncharacterized membrane protein YfcA
MTWAGAALAVAVGIALGLLGGGGAVLTVPVLVYVLGFPPREAVAGGLVVVGLAAAAGAVGHGRSGNVAVRTAAAFGAVAMAGSFAGARLGTRLPGAVQLTAFALVALAAAVLMALAPGAAGDGNDADGDGAETAPRGRLLAAAAGVGLVTGVVGVGGGFLIVPALVLLARLPMRRAVGTSLLVIALNAAAGIAGYVGAVPFRWEVLAPFAALAGVGIAVGTRLSGRVPPRVLRRAFAAMLVVVSVFTLYANRQAFLPGPGPAQPAGAVP